MKKLLITTALVLSTSAAFAVEVLTPETAPADWTPEQITAYNSSLAGVQAQDNVLGSNIGTQNVTNAANSGDTHTTSVTNNAATPNGYISNPNLTTGGSDVCLGSSSGGISAAGIGISGGSTTVDENCVMLKNAKILASLGLKDAAVTLLIISNEKTAEAISLANPELFKTLTNTQ